MQLRLYLASLGCYFAETKKKRVLPSHFIFFEFITIKTQASRETGTLSHTHLHFVAVAYTASFTRGVRI